MPYGTPSYAYTNSVPDQQSLYPDGQHTLAFYIKCVPPVGQPLSSFRYSTKSSFASRKVSGKAPSAVSESNEIARTLHRRCNPHAGNGGLRLYLSNSLSLSVGLSTQDKAINFARSVSQGAHYYHEDVIFLLP